MTWTELESATGAVILRVGLLEPSAFCVTPRALSLPIPGVIRVMASTCAGIDCPPERTHGEWKHRRGARPLAPFLTATRLAQAKHTRPKVTPYVDSGFGGDVCKSIHTLQVICSVDEPCRGVHLFSVSWCGNRIALEDEVRVFSAIRL